MEPNQLKQELEFCGVCLQTMEQVQCNIRGGMESVLLGYKWLVGKRDELNAQIKDEERKQLINEVTEKYTKQAAPKESPKALPKQSVDGDPPPFAAKKKPA